MLKNDLIHYLKRGKSGQIDTKGQGIRRNKLERKKMMNYEKLKKMLKNKI